MKRLVFAFLLLASPVLSGGAFAQDWRPQRIAQLQALDKVTARITVLRAALNQPERFGSLTIVVRACHARPPDEVPDAAAYLEISDSRQPAEANPVFRGWMFAEAPGVSMLQHPVYDIRILQCLPQ